jgi:integrase
MSAPKLDKPIKGSDVWYICWTDGSRSKRVSTRQTDLDKAKAFFAQWLLMEKAQPVPGAEFTVSDLWTIYFDKHVRVKSASVETAEFVWKNLKPHFGDAPYVSITQDSVDAYIQKRQLGKIGQKSQGSTIRRELTVMRACLNWCAHAKRKIIEPNTIPYFDMPESAPPRDRWLRPEEIKKMFDAAQTIRRGNRLSRGERFLWLALETAARKTAILELTWDRVDFETGVIHYNVPGRRQTKKRRSSVPISSTLLPVLLRAYEERRGDLVMENGENIWRTVNIIAEKAGVAGVSPHVLRHTAATLMARRGVPLHQIAGVLGNTIAMVDDVYAHHAPDGLRSAIETISGQEVKPEDLALLQAIKSGKMKVQEVA